MYSVHLYYFRNIFLIFLFNENSPNKNSAWGGNSPKNLNQSQDKQLVWLWKYDKNCMEFSRV